MHLILQFECRIQNHGKSSIDLFELLVIDETVIVSVKLLQCTLEIRRKCRICIVDSFTQIHELLLIYRTTRILIERRERESQNVLFRVHAIRRDNLKESLECNYTRTFRIDQTHQSICVW